MNLYEITELAEKAVDFFDNEIAKLSYAQIKSLLFTLPEQPLTIQGQLIRDRLIVAKRLIENQDS